MLTFNLGQKIQLLAKISQFLFEAEKAIFDWKKHKHRFWYSVKGAYEFIFGVKNNLYFRMKRVNFYLIWPSAEFINNFYTPNFLISVLALI